MSNIFDRVVFCLMLSACFFVVGERIAEHRLLQDETTKRLPVDDVALHFVDENPGVTAAGVLDFTEGSTPTGSASGHATVYADSTAHALYVSSDTGSYLPVLVSAPVDALSTAFTSTTTSLSDVLTVALDVGDWVCDVNLSVDESTAADGAQVFLTDDGVITKTITRGYSVMDEFGLSYTSNGSTTAYDVASWGGGNYRARVFYRVTGAGSVKVQAAQHAHTTGTLTVNTGSYFDCHAVH